MTIGERIKTARYDHGITARELAEMVGTTAASIIRYENGDREPNVNMIQSLSKALNKPIDYFFSDGSDNSLNTDDRELEAFHQYLHDMGYSANIDLARFDLYRDEMDGSGKSDPSWKVWVIVDHRNKKKYTVSTNDMNLLLKSINDYALFQISKLLENAEEL